VYLVHVDKSDPAHIARHNVAKLQKGIARPHAKRGVPAQFVDLTAQLLNFALEAEYFAYYPYQHEPSHFLFLCKPGTYNSVRPGQLQVLCHSVETCLGIASRVKRRPD
jgi:hypothetical protein